MIQPVKAYKASDGTLCESVEKVQQYELFLLLETGGVSNLEATRIADYLIKHRDKLVDILTTGPRSRPARRTINGATTKKRKAKPAAPAVQPATPEQAAAGFAAAHAAVEEAA